MFELLMEPVGAAVSFHIAQYVLLPVGFNVETPLVALLDVDQPIQVNPVLDADGNVKEFPLFVNTDVGETEPPLAFSVVL